MVFNTTINKNLQFTDTSTNTPTSYFWDFGDGVTSTLKNPTHAYTAVGSYTVTHTATNAYGTGTGTPTQVTVASIPILNCSMSSIPASIQQGAKFMITGSTSNGTQPNTISFYVDTVLIASPFGAAQTQTIEADTSLWAVGAHEVWVKVTDSSNPSRTCQTVKQSITITAPAPTTGSISFNSNPQDTDIILDNIDTGSNTPITIPNIQPGSHSYSLRKAGYQNKDGNVSVIANTISNVNETLTQNPTTGSIQFNSTPQGARIIINGTDMGFTTPYLLSSLAAGTVSYTLRKTGYYDKSGSVLVTIGATANVNETLEPIPVVAMKKLSVDIVNPTQGMFLLDGVVHDTDLVVDLDELSTHTLEPIPKPGFVFENWISGFDKITDPNITIVMSENIALKLNFRDANASGGSSGGVIFGMGAGLLALFSRFK